jgi:hypothetical protein
MQALFAGVLALVGITAGIVYLVQSSVDSMPRFSVDLGSDMTWIWDVIMYIPTNVENSLIDNVTNNPIDSLLFVGGVLLGAWAAKGLGLFSSLQSRRKF